MGKGKKSKARKLPKTKCCVSKSKCGRCPLRMLKEGTLPDGFAVKKRVAGAGQERQEGLQEGPAEGCLTGVRSSH